MGEIEVRRYSRLGVVAECRDQRIWTWRTEPIRWQWHVMTGALEIVGTARVAKQCCVTSIAEAVAYTAGVRDGLICKRQGGLPVQM